MSKCKDELYFRRTCEYAYFNDDGNLVTGNEGSCGEQDYQNEEVEKITDKNAKIAELLANGYVETKAKIRYPHSIDDYYDEDVLEAIVNDLEADSLPKHLAIVTWDSCGESIDNDELLEYFIENYDKYKEIEYFTIGDMDYEVCEISWIEHGDTNKFLEKYNHLKGFTIQGTSNNILEVIDMPKLEILEIQGSGLKGEYLKNIGKSKLPNLKKLNIWFGDGNYGCNVEEDDLKEFFNTADFTNLVSLGMCNVAEGLFTHVLKAIFNSKYIAQLKVLNISKSVSLDSAVDFLVENLNKATNLKFLDMDYNYLSKDGIDKLTAYCDKAGITVRTSNSQDDYEEGWTSPMYAE